MRKRFEQQQKIFTIPISEIEIDLRSRHELPPVLAGLQYIYSNPELNSKIFEIIEKKIDIGNIQIGRRGMDLWEILVLATVRLCLNADYDDIEDLANNHDTLRGILGVKTKVWDAERKVKRYPIQTIKDNLQLLDDDIINEINELVVKEGHRIVKKKWDQSLKVKIDTYVLETNVHFPTDLNLLWDSARKCLDMMKYCHVHFGLSGWRKVKNWYRVLKRNFRKSAKACKSGGRNKEKRIKETVKTYLKLAKALNEKMELSLIYLNNLMKISNDLKLKITLINIDYYRSMLIKHIDLVERRLIKGEKIPNEEKIYSIFEPHTEWLSKGKLGKSVELGHKLLVASDQFHFILHHEVIEKKADVHLAVPMVEKLFEKYPLNTISSISLDKGFYSKENKEIIKLKIPDVIMPKKGKLNKEEYKEEHEKNFKKSRNAHSAVESNINQLEHNGLDRCPDKGFDHYKKYAAIGVLAYNLHHLGKILIQKQIQKDKRKTLTAIAV